MASAIGGTTLHSGANLPRPGDKVAQKLSHSDVDNLFLQNQALRWVLVDEVSMIPDELLGSFESHFRDAARRTRYKHRKDRSPRMFGGYNISLFVWDWWQLPPIPDTAALFNPPVGRRSETAKAVLDMFWSSEPSSLNFLAELTEQKRIEDEWYNEMLLQCRNGQLDEENYCFVARFAYGARGVLASGHG